MLRLPFLVDRPSERVVISSRAHAAIVAETHAQHPNETGGILLGHHHKGQWRVIESIDPGPNSRFSPTTFEYDTAYVNHLARKMSGLYEQPLRLIGLWHRHPGSFDRFSGEDDQTNRRYAEQSADGAISCLVNLDPFFRITAYHVPADLAYRRLPVLIGDQTIPATLLEPRRRSCLQPMALEERRQQVMLQTLLANNLEATADAGMDPVITTQIDNLLDLLEGQQRFVYALQPSGADLWLALVERNGLRQLLLRLRASEDQVWLQAQGSAESVIFSPDRLLQLLRESCHG
jgi:proteasome lid subunit RPN8/RPN11